MDSNSLFLTANADTIYNLAVLDLTNGPLVVEVPPMQLGTLNDMWFGWIIDIGAPGPDRGAGGKYLIVPPDYDGPLPDSGFFVGRSKTTHALYAVRAFMENNDPKPAVALIKKELKIEIEVSVACWVTKRLPLPLSAIDKTAVSPIFIQRRIRDLIRGRALSS
jgi:hypothetical protein